jgi:TP901 family phage tail tape measure protein
VSEVNANININIDSSSALSNLRSLETKINQFQRTIASSNASAAANQAALNRALLDGINNTGLFAAKQVNAIDSMARFSNAIDKNKLSLGEYGRFASSQLPGMSRVFRKEFDTMEQIATSRVKAMNTQYIALGKTVDGITKAIAATPTGLASGIATNTAMASQKQMLFNKLIDDGSTKLLNWGKNTQWAGRQLMVGLTLPLGAMGAAAAKAFMEIDKASTSLKRVYGDLSTTTAEIDNNLQAIKALGTEYTKYGIAVSDTIQIASKAAATGATNEGLMAATEQTLRFATLGQIDYNQALDTTISLQTAFGVSNEDLSSKIDFLNAVENQTILTIEDMSLAIPRVATVVKGLGGDVEDLAIMMTAMREGGVSAENAANGLKSGLASMINPTKQANEYLAKFGININKIVNSNKGNLIGTIQAFGKELNKLSDMDRQRALEKTFGKYQFARMSALFDNMTKKSGQAARAMDLAGMSMEDLASIAEKELGTISESTTVKFQAALEKLKATIAPIGEAFLKMATPVISLVTKIAEVFNGLPDPIKNAMGIATAAIAGLGPILLMGIGLMGNLVANIVKGVQWWRKLGARIRGDASAFTYMSMAELEAMAATEALEGSTQSLTGKLLLQKGAVSALTAEYQRFAGAAGIASGAMGRFPRAGSGKGKGGPRLRMANGGVVPGTGSGDKIPAMLEPGETVITKKASKKYGPLITAMNAGILQGFQQGLDPQSSRENLVFAHMQAPEQLAQSIMDKLKKVATGSKFIQQATSMQGFSNFGAITPEKFNKGQMTGKDAAKLFQDPKIVDRTMYPMYEAIARSMGAKTPAQVSQIMQDPAIQNDVRSFANGIGTGLAKAGAKKIGDADFYGIVDKALADAPIQKTSRAAMEKSRNVTTVGAFGGGIRSKGERVTLGVQRQQQVFGKSGGVSYKTTSMIKKAGLVLGGQFGSAVRSALKIKSPSEDAQKVVEQYVDGMEVGARKNTRDAAKAGSVTGDAYSDGVTSVVNAQSGAQVTKQQYKKQQSDARRQKYNKSQMIAAGMSGVQTSRTERRLAESQSRQQIVAAARQRRIDADQRAKDLAEKRRSAAAETNATNTKKRGGRMGGIGRAARIGGGAMGMASMIPFMAQGEDGKFMGMNANTLGTGMMGASMAAEILPSVLPRLLPLLANPVGAVVGVTVAALGGVAIAAKIMTDRQNEAIKKTQEYTDATSGSANAMTNMAKAVGKQSIIARGQRVAPNISGLTKKELTYGTSYLESDQGKSLKDTVGKLSGADRKQNLQAQMMQGIAAGFLTPKQAKAITVAVANSLGDPMLGSQVVASINGALTKDGKSLRDNLASVFAGTLIPSANDPAIKKGLEALSNFRKIRESATRAVPGQRYTTGQATAQAQGQGLAMSEEDKASFFQKSATNAIKYKEALVILKEQLNSGAISQEEFAKQQKPLQSELDTTVSNLTALSTAVSSDKMGGYFLNFAMSMGKTEEQFKTTENNIRDVIGSVEGLSKTAETEIETKIKMSYVEGSLTEEDLNNLKTNLEALPEERSSRYEVILEKQGFSPESIELINYLSVLDDEVSKKVEVVATSKGTDAAMNWLSAMSSIQMLKPKKRIEIEALIGGSGEAGLETASKYFAYLNSIPASQRKQFIMDVKTIITTENQASLGTGSMLIADPKKREAAMAAERAAAQRAVADQEAALDAQIAGITSGLTDESLKVNNDGSGDSTKSWLQQLIADTQANMEIFPAMIKKMKGKGIPDQIIEMIGAGEDGLKRAKEILGLSREKLKKLLANYAKTSVSQAIINTQAKTKSARQKKKAEGILIDQGFSKEDAENISGNTEDVLAIINANSGKSKQSIKKLVAEYRELIAATKEAKTAEELYSDSLDKFNQLRRMMESGFDATEEAKRVELANQFKDANGKTVDEMEKQVSLNQRMIDAQQKIIDGKQEEINDYQRTNDLIQQGTEDLQRQDEIRNRVSSALSHELELMSDAENKIKSAYDERIKALDKVQKINENIANQQKQQLNLAQALSSGDIYAAASAAQEIQASQVQSASDMARSGLEQGVENQINSLRTADGLTRAQAEQQINNIKEQSYQTSLLIRAEEDKIYANNLEVRRLTNEIYDINENKIESLASQNEQYSRILSYHQEDVETAIKGLTLAGLTRQQYEDQANALQDSIDNAKNLTPELLKLVGNYNAIYEAAKAAASETAKLGTSISNPGKSSTTEASSATGLEAIRQNGGGMGLFFAAGGRVPRRFATGGQVGMDSVSARLTPGEFVVRKSMVQKYGSAMFDSINQGSFSMPSYNVSQGEMGKVDATGNRANINAPVYNTYSINVPVNNSGASADEIANVVMTKIRNIDNSSVRRINGY